MKKQQGEQSNECLPAALFFPGPEEEETDHAGQPHHAVALALSRALDEQKRQGETRGNGGRQWELEFFLSFSVRLFSFESEFRAKQREKNNGKRHGAFDTATRLFCTNCTRQGTACCLLFAAANRNGGTRTGLRALALNVVALFFSWKFNRRHREREQKKP